MRRARFPARDRDRFLTHWRAKVLANPTGHVQAVTVGGEVVGNIVAWWQDGRRFVGHWFAQRLCGRGVWTAALRELLQREHVRPSTTPTRSWATPPRCDTGFSYGG